MATPDLPTAELRDRFEQPSPSCQAEHTQLPPIPDSTQPDVGLASGTSTTKPLIYLQDAHDAPSVYLYLQNYTG
jgi:hypothetical protein